MDILFTLHLQGHVVSSVRAVFKMQLVFATGPLDAGEHLIDLARIDVDASYDKHVVGPAEYLVMPRQQAAAGAFVRHYSRQVS